MRTLFETNLSLPLMQKGKVRDIYHVDDTHMLIITTDRLSAFDVVFNQGITGKGIVLTEVANFWFNKLQHIVPNHLSDMPLSDVLPQNEVQQVAGRAIIVKKLKPLPIEAIVRGYLIGSAWKDYQTSGKVCGIDLPKNLRLAEKLPKPIYTPSSKAVIGKHDENICFADTVALVGQNLADKIQNISLEIYQFASNYARKRGIIIADTKFEFGLDKHKQLTLMDEVLTPDSSRFWSADTYQVGSSPQSFDKQIIRDYLETLDWNKAPPAPILPDDIIKKTTNKYQQVQAFLCR